MNARRPYRLTFDDAIEVWLHRWAGEHQHHIAAPFGVNQGRISEVLSGRLHPGSKAAARRMMRKRGPFPRRRRSAR